MAKYRRGRKIEPAVLTMPFKFDVPAQGSKLEFIDLSQCASILNRRFYRQGINWAVAGIKLVSTPGEGEVIVYKLPNTWVMSNSWEKSFRVWQKMNREALAESDSVRPKFLDFKIYADEQHHAAGFGANLLPYQYAPVAGPVTAGEWEASKIHIPDTTTPGTVDARELIAVGPSFPGGGASGLNAVSLIEGYAASRGLPYPEDPNVPADADSASGIAPQNWMAALFNDGTTQNTAVLDDMIGENNQAPYPFEGDGLHLDTMYPGGANQNAGLELHDIEKVSGTTIGGTTHLKGGNFPCGLIGLFVLNNTDAVQSYTMTINLVPGHHRGYLCEPMTEM